MCGVKILIATDVFPPHCGGSGWSAYYLAQALQERGHAIHVVKPQLGQVGILPTEYNGLRVVQFGHPIIDVPFVRNLFKNEYFYRRFARFLERYIAAEGFDLIHAQHVMTTPPAVEMGGKLGVPVVSTVRDYWPLCIFSTLLRDGQICADCHFANRVRCLRSRYGSLFPAALPFLPYIQANLGYKQEALARSDAITALSSYLKERLERVIGQGRVQVVPNFVDVDALRKIAQKPPRLKTEGPYLLYVGKLAENKGVLPLLEALQRSRVEMPTLVVGTGPLEGRMRKIVAREGLKVRFLGWLPQREVIRLMARALLLLFPSLWPEPWGRVLLEAAAVRVPAVALDRGGGPRDIIEDGYNGVLTADEAEFAYGLDRLVRDRALRETMGRRAMEVAGQRFSKPVVIEQFEKVYHRARGGKRRL